MTIAELFTPRSRLPAGLQVCLAQGRHQSGTGGRPHEISATYVANLGIGALVQGFAAELAPDIRVNAVAPTFMGGETAFWKRCDAMTSRLRKRHLPRACR